MSLFRNLFNNDPVDDGPTAPPPPNYLLDVNNTIVKTPPGGPPGRPMIL